MNLSPNQLRTNALAFSKEWKNDAYEKGESQTFWNQFFAVFGIDRRRVGIYEAGLKKSSGNQGFIDVFWPGQLLCEQKSRGGDLDQAESQAKEYLRSIADNAPNDLPDYTIVSDFEFMRLRHLHTDEVQEFRVSELADYLHLFGFLSGYLTQIRGEEEKANIKAAERMGQLHDKLEENGYTGHELDVLLIRLLFCLFAEDTGIFNKFQFSNLITQRTREDGSDMAGWISQLFEVLNKHPDKRLKNQDQQLLDFPYINGDLFAEYMPSAAFDAQMRTALVEASKLDWSQISPEIFGALFQSVMDKVKRRDLGAHYTSETNILKITNSLFMGELRAEFIEIKSRSQKNIRLQALDQFHQKIASYTFLDPACGCGNFLVVSYRELRLLELEVIELIHAKNQLLDINTVVRCKVSNFYGIEIEEFPAQIAKVAMWLVDHQMNRLVSEHFGIHFARIPLVDSAHIQHADALKVGWPVTNYILGNPPFSGSQKLGADQKSIFTEMMKSVPKAGTLDFVTAWYVKSAELMHHHPNIKGALVSTNSITQGEQVNNFWPYLQNQGLEIQFAHRTFEWESAARGKAAVHCVIIGFAAQINNSKQIFDYTKPKADPILIDAKNINGYLVDSSNNYISSRRSPLATQKKIVFGSMANDGGNLFINSREEYEEIISSEPNIKKYIKRFLGAKEFLHGIDRWCIWLIDADPTILKASNFLKSALIGVNHHRLSSDRKETRALAKTPGLFGEIRQPKNDYLLIPIHSSKNRDYIPIGFVDPSVICGNANLLLPEAEIYEFGIMSSIMHNAWMRTTCGRIKSDYRYSASVVYNNFPWPVDISGAQKIKIEECAQAVLDARLQFPDSSLADLYDPLTMPPLLTKAHQALDKAVDAAYWRKSFKGEAERVAFLFERYLELVEST